MADRPNILLIHADQHRYDCLGAYGNPDVRTPNIDALARGRRAVPEQLLPAFRCARPRAIRC